MKLFTVEQFRTWDKITVQKRNISSIDLMDYAAAECVKWLLENFSGYDFVIICGNGNNGGDGLSISRQLQLAGENVYTYIPLYTCVELSEDCKAQAHITIFETHLPDEEFFQNRKYIIVDAVSGTGLRYPADERIKYIIEWINKLNATVVSIDIPSGLPGNFYNFDTSASVVKARYILTFQIPKLSFFQPDSLPFYQDWILIDIGLNEEFYLNENSDFYLVDNDCIQKFLVPRNSTSNKYTYGHLLLYVGSKSMPGAGILSVMGAVRSGIGLITLYQTHDTANQVIYNFPELQLINQMNNLSKYDVLTIGCGIENNRTALEFINQWIKLVKPMVVDATALELMKEIWEIEEEKFTLTNSDIIITPHLGEYRKVFNLAKTGFFDQVKHEKDIVKKYKITLVSKGPFTRIYNKDGKCYINNMASSSLSKAGAGDILAGLIGGIRGWVHDSFSASVLGVYFHGKAALEASEKKGEYSVRITEIANSIRIGSV